MEMPTLNSPASLRRNPKSAVPAFLRHVALSECKTNIIGTSFAPKKQKRSNVKISVNAKHTDSKDDEGVDLSDTKVKGWIHFVGVGGCGLSGLAMLAHKQGYEVSGSDIVWSSYMNALKEAGVRLYVGHSQLNMQRPNGLGLPDAIVVSSAIPPDNVEILHAKSIGVPVYKRGVWLGKITENYNLVAVSGSHGKSTTASMIAYVMKQMGYDLTALIGASVPQFDGGNIIYGTDNHFVVEADEYDGCFLQVSPHIAVVTNVDWEHVDIFDNEEVVRTVFRRFLRQIRTGGHLILCGDSVGASSLLSDKSQVTMADMSNGVDVFPSLELRGDSYRVMTYGISSSNEWHASSVCSNPEGGSDYKLCHRGCPIADIRLQVPGVHNVLNSLAVIATINALLDDRRRFYESIDLVQLHLNNFKGVSRRFEMIGKIGGCHIYDDYAHHPTEIRAVLQAARQRFPSEELLVIFQPHTYSRLAALKREFATAFSDADRVVVTEIYAARETNMWNISGKELATSIVGPPSEFIPSLVDIVKKLVLEISKNPNCETVILTIGAGDVTMVGHKLLHELQQKLRASTSVTRSTW